MNCSVSRSIRPAANSTHSIKRKLRLVVQQSLSLSYDTHDQKRERREKYERDIQTVQLSLVVAQKAPSWRPEYNAATAPHVPAVVCVSVIPFENI